MSKFKVGQRVISKDSVNLFEEYEEDQAIRGVVESLGEGDKVSIKWDRKFMSPNPEILSVKELLTEVEGDAKLSTLEADYESWAGPIREKLKAAADLILEAVSLSNKKKRDLVEMHELVSPLIHAMDTVGWRTSSLNC